MGIVFQLWKTCQIRFHANCLSRLQSEFEVCVYQLDEHRTALRRIGGKKRFDGRVIASLLRLLKQSRKAFHALRELGIGQRWSGRGRRHLTTRSVLANGGGHFIIGAGTRLATHSLWSSATRS